VFATYHVLILQLSEQFLRSLLLNFQFVVHLKCSNFLIVLTNGPTIYGGVLNANDLIQFLTHS